MNALVPNQVVADWLFDQRLPFPHDGEDAVQYQLAGWNAAMALLRQLETQRHERQAQAPTFQSRRSWWRRMINPRRSLQAFDP